MKIALLAVTALGAAFFGRLADASPQYILVPISGPAGTVAASISDTDAVTFDLPGSIAFPVSPIDAPGSLPGLTFVTATNAAGTLAVGFFLDGSAATHGFTETLPSNTFATVDAPGALAFTELTGVNNAGHFVGFDVDLTSGALQSFAQIPEPATLSLLGLGAIGLVIARRRQI